MNLQECLKKMLPAFTAASEQRRAAVRYWFRVNFLSGQEETILGLINFHDQLVRCFNEAEDVHFKVMSQLALCCATEELERQIREIDEPCEDSKELGEKLAKFLLNTKGKSGRSIASELSESDGLIFLEIGNDQDQEEQP